MLLLQYSSGVAGVNDFDHVVVFVDDKNFSPATPILIAVVVEVFSEGSTYPIGGGVNDDLGGGGESF